MRAILRFTLTLIAVLAAAAPAAAFEIQRAELVHGSDDRWRLSAAIDYELPPRVRKALDSGIPLTVSIRVEVHQPRWWWWWDEELFAVERDMELRYQPLSRRYRLDNGERQRYFFSTDSMLWAMGRVEGITVAEGVDPNALAGAEVRLRTRLEIDKLPPPLQTSALISADWRIGSNWYVWRLAD